MAKHTLKILQQMLQDFYSVFDHFGTLCIKGLLSEIHCKELVGIVANNGNKIGVQHCVPPTNPGGGWTEELGSESNTSLFDSW